MHSLTRGLFAALLAAAAIGAVPAWAWPTKPVTLIVPYPPGGGTDVIARMNKEIATVVARPEVKAKLLEQGAEGVSSTPEALGRMVKREIEEWRAVVKRARIEGE